MPKSPRDLGSWPRRSGAQPRSAPSATQSAERLLGFVLVLFAAVAVAMRPLLPGHSVETNLWVEMCVFVAAMAWLVRMAMAGRLRLVRTGMGLPALVLLAVALVSTLRSPDKGASLATLLEWISYAALFFVLANGAADSLDRRFFLRLLWASAFAVFLYGLFQQFVNLPLLREQILSDPERVRLELGLSEENYSNLVERARGRIFSTFLLANSFAGFITLVLPGYVGYVLDRLRAGDRRKGFLAVSGLWVAAGLACLLLTYSRGGWLAFGIAATVFCVLLGRRLLRQHLRLVAGLLAAAAVAAGVLFGSGAIPTRIFRTGVASFDVRLGYWRGAVAMARDHWLGGAGLGTFGSNYRRYRWVTARVTLEAHNDYLQVLAELGIFGLLAFVWVWGACLRGAFARLREPGGRVFPRRLGYGAGLMAFALGAVVAGSFTLAGWGTEAWWPVPKAWLDFALMAALAAAWLAFFALLGRSERFEPGELCRKGLAVGLLAFLLHCFVDFDYSEPGVALTAWAVAALAVTPLGPAFERRLGSVPAVALGAAALLALCAFEYVLLRDVRAETDSEVARSLVSEAFRTSSPAERLRLMEDAREHYELALRGNPLDADLRLAYGDFLASLLAPDFRNPALFGQVTALYERAAELNRVSPAPHVRLAQLFERAADAGLRAPLADVARRYQARQRPSGANAIYLPAVVEYEAAIGLDPNRPDLRYHYAVVLEKFGNPQAAREQVELALELHATLVAEHEEHVLRLKGGDLAGARQLLKRLQGRSGP